MSEFPYDISIVGSNGKMGKMLVAKLKSNGYKVLEITREHNNGKYEYTETTLKDKLPKAKFVMVSVPVTVMKETLQTICPYLQSNQVLADVTSVKTLPMKWMEEYFAGSVIGTHPLFGPLPKPEDLRVVVTPGKRSTEEYYLFIKEAFESFGCVVFKSTAEEHDEKVGFAQSLNFALTASFFATLARQDNITPFLTPSFKRLMEAARKHLTQDTQMFCEFTSANPLFTKVLSDYQKTLEEINRGNLPKIAQEAAIWYKEN